MAQDQLWKPQPTRRSGGRAFAYRGSHLPHAEPQFTRLSRSRHPLTPKSAISPFAADNSPDYLNYYAVTQGAYRVQTGRTPVLQHRFNWNNLSMSRNHPLAVLFP